MWHNTMRNLPDDELFNQVKTRLQNFQEQPNDDIWGAIAANISTAEPGWIRVAEKLSLVFILLLLLGARYGGMMAPGNGVATHGIRKPEINSSADLSTSATGTDTLKMNREIPQLATNAHNQTVAGDEHQELIVPSDVAVESTWTTSNFERPSADAAAPNGSPITNSMSQSESLSKETDSITAGKIQDSASVSTVLPAQRARRKKSAVRFYALATPSLTFLNVVPSTSDAATFQKLNSPGIFSKERLSVTFEMGAQALMARRLMIFAGLSYFQKSMDLSLEQTENGSGSFTSNGSLGFDFQPQTTTTTVQYRQQNVGATAGLAYVVRMGKIVHQMGGSLQYEYGILHRSTDKKKSDNFLSYRLFYRVEYGLNERLSLFIQPTFFRSLIAHDALDGAIQVKQSRAGVGIGVVYRIPN
jgi:hypothetical protein